MKLRVRVLDLDAEKYVAVLNERTAKRIGEGPDGRVEIVKDGKKVVAILNTAKRSVKEDEVGVLLDVAEVLNLKDGDVVEVFPEEPPRSIEAIRKKIFGEKLSKEEIEAIIGDVVEGALFPAEASAFIVAAQINGLDEDETVYLTEAIANSGQRIDFDGVVVDKHSIGGVPGNRITFFFVPIMASLGFKVPKTSSRAITSPSGTADTMEVVARVDLSAEEIKEIVERVGGVIAWGGGANIASADDRLIQIRRPLRLDPLGMVLASVMAKKLAVSSKYVVLDLPVGPEAKLRSFSEARDWERRFKELGERLGIKVIGFVSNGIQPIGRGIGPALEMRDVLMTYTGEGSKDLLEKGVEITARLLSVLKKVPISRARKMAMDEVRSGRAEAKLREIIEAQGGDPEVRPEDIEVGRYQEEVISPADGKVSYISIQRIAAIARYAGAPVDKGAGIWMNVKIGDRVKRGDVLFTLFSSSKRKLKAALEVENPVRVQ
ncbi:MAG: AMP phosphorylase [Candidatus Diapherotrites archaeon]|nr:AMP phosphorylase [Candidatus Diapherotrites archaeon]